MSVLPAIAMGGFRTKEDEIEYTPEPLSALEQVFRDMEDEEHRRFWAKVYGLPTGQGLISNYNAYRGKNGPTEPE